MDIVSIYEVNVYKSMQINFDSKTKYVMNQNYSKFYYLYGL